MTDIDHSKTKKKIDKFSELMLAQMTADGRGDWGEKAILTFYSKIAGISVEVFKAIENNDFDTVIKKSIDGANYYMMLADRVGGLA